MNIYLRHDRHGNKVAICEDEALADELNGWTRYTIDNNEEVQQKNEFAKRRGRPPMNKD